jgi:hypothetical protein
MLPAILEARKTGFYGEMSVFAVNMLASAVYHACDYRFYCFGFKSHTLHFLDFFFSYFSVCVSLIYLAKLKPETYKTSAYVISVVLLLVAGEQSNYKELSTALLVTSSQPPLFAVAIPVCSYASTVHRVSKARYGSLFSMEALRDFLFESYNFDWRFVLGALCSLCGAALMHLVETNHSYFLVTPTQVHSAWHVCIMLSAYFTMRIPYFRA